MADLTPEHVTKALRGDHAALGTLVSRLTPVVQGRVARVLLRSGAMRARGGDIRQDVQDLTQDAFERLFAQGGRVLSSWQPERGLSLEAFVGLVAERSALSTMCSRRKNPLSEAPTEGDVLERGLSDESGPEERLAAAQLTSAILVRLQATLSPLGFQVFQGLFCECKSAEAVCSELGLSAEALYMWRYRIRKLVADLHAELSGAEHVRSAP